MNFNEVLLCIHQFLCYANFSQFEQLKKKTNFLLVQNSFFLSLSSWNGGGNVKENSHLWDKPPWKTLKYDIYSERNGIWHIFWSLSLGKLNTLSAWWGPHSSLTKVIFKHFQDQFSTRVLRISFDLSEVEEHWASKISNYKKS